MAKTKKKHTKKKNNNFWIWLIVILVVLILGGAIWYFTSNNKETTESTETPTQEVEQTQEEKQTEEGTLEEITYQPEQDFKCDTNYVIGYDPKSSKCEELPNGDFLLTIKNSGRGDLEGLWFFVTSVNGDTAYFKSDGGLAVGESKEFELKIKDWEAKLGGKIVGVEVQPMKVVDGKEYACVNQRIIAIVDSTCKD